MERTEAFAIRIPRVADFGEVSRAVAPKVHSSPPHEKSAPSGQPLNGDNRIYYDHANRHQTERAVGVACDAILGRVSRSLGDWRAGHCERLVGYSGKDRSTRNRTSHCPVTCDEATEPAL
jgi:hypothetical protein